MLSTEETYNKHLESFTAISENEIKTPKMARDDTIGESEELKIVALQDSDSLIKSGCSEIFITTLDERIGAYSHASSIWENSEFAKSESKKQWIEKEKIAYEFKSDLLHNLGYALRKNPDELKYVKKISAGRGKRDLVLDFKDISVLGKRNIDALKAIGFDPANLEKAESMYDTLSNLLSSANMSSGELSELKNLAYQAYTYLQQAVEEIRETGQFVFWKDKKRLDLYKSDHFQKSGRAKKNNENEEIEPEMS